MLRLTAAIISEFVVEVCSGKIPPVSRQAEKIRIICDDSKKIVFLSVFSKKLVAFAVLKVGKV